MSTQAGPVLTPQAPSLVAAMANLSLGPQGSAPAAAAAASRTAPAVQQVFNQTHFNEQNDAFEQVYAGGRRWNPMYMHFSKVVYTKADGGFVNEMGQYVKSQDSIEVCADHIDHKSHIQHEGSICLSNLAIKVLNTYLKNPLKSLGASPTDAQIAEVYKTIMARLTNIPQNLGPQDRLEMIKRTKNISANFFQEWLCVFVKWKLRTTAEKDPRAIARALLSNSAGSLADALGCELWRQFMAFGH